MKVNHTLKCYSPGTTTLLSSVKVGQEFDLALLTQDLRPDGTYLNTYTGLQQDLTRGVFAAYVNINFDKSLVKINVFEVQNIVFAAFAPLKGQFNISFLTGGLGTTAPIVFDNSTAITKANTALAIQNALNKLLSVNAVRVTAPTTANTYKVEFIKFPDTVEPKMYFNLNYISSQEVIRGDNAITAIKFSPEYFNVKHVQNVSSGLAALGSVASNFVGMDTNQYEVLRIKMKALKAGTQVFAPNVDGLAYPIQNAFYYTLVYGNILSNPVEESEVDINDISLVSTTLTINN